MKLSSPKLKKLIFFLKQNFLYFGREVAKPEKQKFLYFSKKKFFPHFGMTADQAVKEKNPLYSRMTAD